MSPSPQLNRFPFLRRHHKPVIIALPTLTSFSTTWGNSCSHELESFNHSYIRSVTLILSGSCPSDMFTLIAYLFLRFPTSQNFPTEPISHDPHLEGFRVCGGGLLLCPSWNRVRICNCLCEYLSYHLDLLFMQAHEENSLSSLPVVLSFFLSYLLRLRPRIDFPEFLGTPLILVWVVSPPLS